MPKPHRWNDHYHKIEKKEEESKEDIFIRLLNNRASQVKFKIDSMMKLVSKKNGKNYKFENQNIIMIETLLDLLEHKKKYLQQLTNEEYK